MNIKGKLTDSLLFILMASFWGLNYSILKLALNFEPPFYILFFRTLFALITSIIFIIPFSSSIRRVNFIDTFILGFFNIFLFMGLWFIGEEREPASISSILVYTYPIISVMFSILFLGENLSLNKLLGLILGFSGIVLIASNNVRNGGLLGIILLIGSAVSWSIGTTYFRKKMTDYTVQTVNFLQYVFSLPLVGIFLLFEKYSPINYYFLAYTFYMGFFGTSIAYLIYLYLVGKHGIIKVNPYLFLVPALGTVFSLLINRETIGQDTIYGLFLVGLGVYLSFRN